MYTVCHDPIVVFMVVNVVVYLLAFKYVPPNQHLVNGIAQTIAAYIIGLLLVAINM